MNATRAYKEVYKVSQKTAEASGVRMLGNVKVGAYIEKRLKNRFEQAEIDGQWVIDRLKELVERCMQKVPVMVSVGSGVKVQKTEIVEMPDGKR